MDAIGHVDPTGVGSVEHDHDRHPIGCWCSDRGRHAELFIANPPQVGEGQAMTDNDQDRPRTLEEFRKLTGIRTPRTLAEAHEVAFRPTPEEAAQQKADFERQDREAMREVTGLPNPADAANNYEWTRAQQYWKRPPEPPDLPPLSSEERQVRKGRGIIGLTTFAAIVATIGVPLAIFDKFGFLLAGTAAIAGYLVSRAYYQVWEAVGRAVDRLENERWEERRLQLEGKVQVIVKVSAP